MVTEAELSQLKTKNIAFRFVSRTPIKLSTDPDGYLTPEQVIQELENIHTRHPTTTKLFEFGKTHELRPMMALEISAPSEDTDKPALIFNAMHHAREVMTTEVIMHMAKVLTEGYGQDLEISNWLDKYRIVLVPQVNPDGNAFVANGQIMWRKNAYKLYGSTVGVDLNRNYPAYWDYCNGADNDPYSEIYRGRFAGSEPETQAMINLAMLYKPVASISYHAFSEMILYPNGCFSVNNPAKDLFQSIGQSINAKIRNDNNKTNAYEVGSIAEIIYEADGSDVDWLWKELGIFSFAIEVNSEDFRPDYKTWRNITVKRQEGGWKALIARLSKSGFRAHIQTLKPEEVTYSLKKITKRSKTAFDADTPERLFPLKSKNGLLYQLTEKGQYEVMFYINNQPIKSITITIGNSLVDLGNITI